jgi:Glyoxalase-like domain
MAQRVQIAIDCHDPDRLALFWSEVLGYRYGPPPGFDSWRDYSATVAEEPGESWARIHDPDRVGPSLLFHRVPEQKVVKNRVHLDVRAPTGTGDRRRDIGVFVDRIIALGGIKVREVVDDAGLFVVMQDPEQNEFCVGGGTG